MFEKCTNKIEYNGVEKNRTKNGLNLQKNHDLQETDVFCKKQTYFARNRTRSPRRPAISPPHPIIPCALTPQRSTSCKLLYNARSITKRLGTRQSCYHIFEAPPTRIRIRLHPQTFCCGFKTLEEAVLKKPY